MNNDTIEGHAKDIGGTVKEAAGDLTGNDSLRGEGVADQLSGKAQKVVGAAKEAIANPGPLIDQAKGFAKANPFAVATLAGVLGMALLNTLRGKK